MNFYKWNVATRLALGFVSTLVLLAVVAAVSDHSMRRTSNDTDALLSEKLKNERLIGEWKTIIAVNVPRTQAAGLTSDPATQRMFEGAIAANSRRATELLDILSSSLQDPTAKSLYAAALEQRKIYPASRATALKEKAAGNLERANAYFNHELANAAKAYLGAVDKLALHQQSLITAIGADIYNRSRQARWRSSH